MPVNEMLTGEFRHIFPDQNIRVKLLRRALQPRCASSHGRGRQGE
jgi:hypothetical protein